MRSSGLFSGGARRSLRLKVTLGVVLPLLVILGVFTAIEYARHREATLADLSSVAAQTGQVIESSLLHEMLSRNVEGLQHMLNAIGEDKKIRAIYLLDTTGRVAFAPQGVDVGRQMDNRDPTCQPCHQLPAAARPSSVVVTLPDGQRVFRSMNPIENRPECHACHDPHQRLNGVLLTDIWVAPLETPLAADLRENVLWWVATIVITVIVVNVAMSRMVIRRLEQVAQTLTRFGRGQLGLRLPAESPDEIGQLAAAFNQMGGRIQSEEAENRALSEDLRRHGRQRQELLERLITAQEEERRKVARDLHDDLGQDLAGLAASLEGAERLWSERPDLARSQLRQARSLIAETTERAYAMILSLRPSALDDLGLAPTLRAHAERTLRDAGIQFDLDSGELTRRLPPEIETALFRTFQEALSNVVRHSGARRVRLSLTVRDGSFDGEIADDGSGFDPTEVQVNGHGRRGLGLLGMQERVAQCGGALEIRSSPGAGTRIRVRIPLLEDSPHPNPLPGGEGTRSPLPLGKGWG
ncbi:MAG: HAMP domain-containing protein [Chloroflexi bacterium]|nr:HAMP domain-containing protein [Chloroflexota bacterium]